MPRRYLSPSCRRGVVDDYFVLQPIGGLWVVVSSGIIVARCPTVPEAIKAAVQVASRMTGYGRRSRCWSTSREEVARSSGTRRGTGIAPPELALRCIGRSRCMIPKGLLKGVGHCKGCLTFVQDPCNPTTRHQQDRLMSRRASSLPA